MAKYEPKSAKQLLGGVLAAVQSKTKRAVFDDALRAELGGELSEHCSVRNFRNGTLTIEVASAPLFAELSSFRRESLREGINRHLTDQQVAKVVFRVDGTGHA